jgi:glycosyltransferase involved in cell wall biosynthesis
MQICFVCCEYPPGPHGGVGTFTQVLARALVAAGHQVRVVGIYKDSYPAPDYENDQGVQVWRLRRPKYRLGWIRARVHLFRTISAWAKQGAIDLVEVPDWQGWAAGWPRLRVPVVARLNGSASYFAAELGESISRGTFWLERASMLRADHWCSVSQYTADQTRKVFQLQSQADAILPNPVEVPHLSAKNQVARSKFDVVFSGALIEKKGVFSLMKAWPQVLRDTRGMARLHLYGKERCVASGQMTSQVLRGMLSADEQQTVQFYGHVDREQLRMALSQARLAVFPSYAEAFAIAPLEAMSTGCPTIYGNCGPSTELIDDRHNGILVNPHDPSDIAAAITLLIRNDELATRIGKAGQALIQQRFTDTILLKKNIQFFEFCLGLESRTSANETQATNYPRLADPALHSPLVKR